MKELYKLNIFKINIAWIMTKKDYVLNASTKQSMLKEFVNLLMIYAKLGMNKLVSVLHVIRATKAMRVFAKLQELFLKILTVLNGIYLENAPAVDTEVYGKKENAWLLMKNVRHGIQKTQNVLHATKDANLREENANTAIYD